MGGSNRSLVVITAVNLRAADVPTYYAAHSKNGVNVSQRLTCRMAVNKPGKANDGKGTVQYLNMTFWGKMADVAARSIGKGKELSCCLDLNVFKGKAFHNGNPVFVPGANGAPEQLMVEKVGFELQPGTLIFGADADDQIRREIEAGQRPIGWDIKGSPAAIAWKQQLDIRNATPFNPAIATFGHAKVVLASGAGIGAYDHSKDKAYAAKAAPTGQPVMATVEQSVIAAVGAALPAAPPVPAPAMVSVQGV
jgi:hypothetical protein